ncbi:MAG TPA: hypothetical protein VFQ43_00530 [Nitrososphaera sp.]|nr:MAG: hypothetical protein DMF63_02065 [Acidobacteriota bacterium]HEU0046070.1 hypothetical protein [Nitrososphaera sp.]
MTLVEAVVATGPIPPDSANQAEKKRYSEVLSSHLAKAVASGLRDIGFPNVKPDVDGVGEKTFQGGLGPKRVDVSYSDDQNGLLLAVSIKTINFPPFGKNLKNRFGDLLTESITLHLRFPYSVVCMLFAFPVRSNEDVTKGRKVSTFQRARKLFATVTGRLDYTQPGEKFEDVTLMLFEPHLGDDSIPKIELFDAATNKSLTESEFFQKLKEIYNVRNPHALIGEEDLEDLG